MKIGDRMMKAIDKVGLSPILLDRGLMLKELTNVDLVYDLVDEAYVIVNEQVDSGHCYYFPDFLEYRTMCREAKAYGVYKDSELEFRILCLPYMDFVYVVSAEPHGIYSCIDYMRTGIEDMPSDGIAVLIMQALVKVDFRCEGLLKDIDPDKLATVIGN